MDPETRVPPAPDLTLDRGEAVPAIVGRHHDFLIVTGLAGAAKDVASLSDDAPNVFTMGGAMGAATSIGLGLALAVPRRQVLVVTGEGELLMNLGSLATVAALDPPNLSILCVDNARYGETGYQRSHTAFRTDLEQVARGAGIRRTMTARTVDDLAAAHRLLRDQAAAAFVVVRVNTNPPPPYRRDFDGAACRLRFRAALQSGLA
ncbi:MAG: thiamine pyrophosphate-dependent enzyme [Candidatus Dormibacteraceae bacterium]